METARAIGSARQGLNQTQLSAVAAQKAGNGPLAKIARYLQKVSRCRRSEFHTNHAGLVQASRIGKPVYIPVSH
ncbi:MAG: hypothetical protein WBX25_21055 [Rhodomicrobium sp.]